MTRIHEKKKRLGVIYYCRVVVLLGAVALESLDGPVQYYL